MQRAIEHAAGLTVGRDCGLAGIAITACMAGMAGEPHHALRTGAILALVACIVLTGRAFCALRWNYRRTDVWEMLSDDKRPNDQFAQRLIGLALKRACLRFALHAAYASAGLALTSIALGMASTPVD